MNLRQYVKIVAKRHGAGISSEHSYWADLEKLIRELVLGVDITNDPLKVPVTAWELYIGGLTACSKMVKRLQGEKALLRGYRTLSKKHYFPN